jgi:hypothetical protein
MAKPQIQFNQEYWEELITRPNWYFKYVELQKRAKQVLGEESEPYNELKNKLRVFFEEALLQNKLEVAASGPNLDKEREPIDTIVIHHTSAKPGYRLSYMNAVQLLNIYAPYFAKPKDEREKSLSGQPVWSNHFRGGKPSFLAYHWLMRMDGSFERLLEDSQIGWHAANWDINKRSIAICLDNDYEKQDPTEEILQKLAKFINKQYSNISNQRIVGHGEVSRNPTICPGTNFTMVWKPKLSELLTRYYVR